MPPKRGAFYYFMLHIKDKDNISLVKACDAANKLWANMSEDEKQPYIDRAGPRNAIPKYDCAQVRIKEQDKLNKNVTNIKNTKHALNRIDMNNHINNMISHAIASNDIQNKYFHVLHLNDFVYVQSVNRHYPAEIALARFNLKEGYIQENIYSEIIKPGKLPLGFSCEAKTISNQTHKIPPPTHGQESNLHKIMEMIEKFMQVTKTHANEPIFVDDNLFGLISSVFDCMCKEFGYARKDYKLYSLQKLFLMIRNSIGDTLNVWPSISMSKLELAKDIYDFTPKIACDFHELIDCPKHCSRSTIIRYIYVICDNCCPPLRIELIRGQHVPLHSNTEAAQADCLSDYFTCTENASSVSISAKDSASAISDYSYLNEATTTPDFADLKLDDNTKIAALTKINIPLVKPALRRPYEESATALGPNFTERKVIGKGRGRAVRIS